MGPWLWAALWASLLLAAAERGLTALLDPGAPGSLTVGLTVWALHAVLAGLLALGLALASAFGRGAGLLLALGGAFPLSRVGAELGAGAIVSRLGAGQWVTLGVVLCGMAGLALIGQLFLRQRAGRSRVASALVGGLLLTVADAVLRPGLQLSFHLACLTLATVLALVALRPRHPRSIILPALLLLLAAGHLASQDHPGRAAAVLASQTARNIYRGWLGPAPLTEPAEPEDTRARQRAQPRPAPKRDVVVVVVDALRDDLHAEMPHTAAWRSGTLRFERSYAQASSTHLSLLALLRGVEAGRWQPWPGPTLPALFSAHGYRTVAVLNSVLSADPELAALLSEGFQHVSFGTEAQIERALSALSNPAPTFVLLHLYATHKPGFAGRQLSWRDGSWPRRYRRSAAWLDTRLRSLFEALAARRPTIIALTSDHGEALGAHRIETHGPTIFEAEVRVPLSLKVPGMPGRRLEGPAGNIDLAPTLTALVADPGERLDLFGHDTRLDCGLARALLTRPGRPASRLRRTVLPCRRAGAHEN